MRIVIDVDGDVWQEVPPVPAEIVFKSLTGDYGLRTLAEIKDCHGPARVLELLDSE